MSHIPSLDSINNADWDFQHLRPSVFESNAANDSAQLFPIESQSKTEARVRMINAELSSMGFPSMIAVEDGQLNVMVDVLVQNTLRLLDSYMKSLSIKTELESRLRRVESDFSQVQKMYRRCQENLAESQNANAMAKERERRLKEDNKELSNKLKTSSEEVRKLQINIQRNETQAAHERRKLERENVHLRERLSSSLSRPISNVNPQNRTSRQHRVSVAGSGVFGSLSSLNADTDTLESAVRRGGAQQGRGLVKSPSLSRVSGKPFRRPTVSPSSITPSARSEPKSVRPWTVYDTASIAAAEGNSQADLYALVVQQLEERQSTLLYENRELRDAISQIASRFVRFTGFLERTIEPPGNEANAIGGDVTKPEDSGQLADDGFDSLDEATDEEQPQSTNRGSSDDDAIPSDDRQAGTSQNDASRRRHSAGVNELLLQLPYALVREHLMQKLRKLSRRLWRQLRKVRTLRSAHGPQSPVLNGTAAPPEQPPDPDQSAKESVNAQCSESELASLRSLVAKYKSRIQEQDVALRHALFSSSRRWNGLGFSDSFDHDQDASQPRRRSSVFKLNNSPSKGKSSSEMISSGLALPEDGAGDRVSSTLGNSAVDVNAVEDDACIEVVRDFQKTQNHSVSGERVIEIQRVDRTKQTGYSSDASNMTSAQTTFTSSPFAGRAIALSVVDD